MSGRAAAGGEEGAHRVVWIDDGVSDPSSRQLHLLRRRLERADRRGAEVTALRILLRCVSCGRIFDGTGDGSPRPAKCPECLGKSTKIKL